MGMIRHMLEREGIRDYFQAVEWMQQRNVKYAINKSESFCRLTFRSYDEYVQFRMQWL